MKIQHYSAPIVALALVVSVFATAGYAKSKSVDVAQPNAETQALMNFSHAGNNAIHDVREARFAIFDGHPKTAMEYMKKAKASIDIASREAPTFDIKTTTTVQGKTLGADEDKLKAGIVPVEGQVVLVDNFVMTPQKMVHISKANEHFKKGEQKQALDELRQGAIDVNFARQWMAIAPARAHLDEAITLTQENKYYEASLALKAIEDGITTDSVALTESPTQK